MQTYDDAYLNYWADIYIKNNIKKLGYTLTQFLNRPNDILNQLNNPTAPILQLDGTVAA